MQCPMCKQILEPGVRFCPNDGTPLVDTSATRAEATPTGGHRPASKELQLPVVIGNRYRLEGLRGGGGMAKVYRAIDVTLEREVAVKLINPELRNETEFDARFQREARIASQLGDPHIVVVHDFGLDPTHGPYLVMEYLQGQSLRERLACDGKLPLKAALQLAGQIFLALIHAHDKGIVHRDIKPDNIFLLNQSGVRLHVRVLDFGIARIYRRDDPGSVQTITHAGAVLGTPRYMSPEQLAGQTVDARSDLYSAALVLFEALTGKLPYTHGGKLCDLCPEASPALQELLEACLKPNPDERPKSAVEVYLRLQELGKASGILLLPPGALDRMVAARKQDDPTVAYDPKTGKKGGSSKRRALLWLGAVILILGLVALGKWWFGGPGPHDGPESLHGIHIGDTVDEAEGKLTNLSRVDRGNPWKIDRVKAHLGNVLDPADLPVPQGSLDEVLIRRTADEKVLVLFHNEKVIAVVSTHTSATTNRTVKVHNDEGAVARQYSDHRYKLSQVDLPGAAGVVDVRRYDTLGVGFESQRGLITSITLYPAKK